MRLAEPGQSFNIAPNCFLDGVALEVYLDIPRRKDENGKIDTDIFSLKLKNDHEIHRFRENTIVELVPGNMPCLPPWTFDTEELSAQLAREIGRDHILYGKDLKTLAKRQDNDDVLFAVFGTDFKYAKVHLTWSKTSHTDTRWPATQCYKDWTDVYENLLVVDHEGWNSTTGWLTNN